MCVTKDSGIEIWMLLEYEDNIPAAFGVLLLNVAAINLYMIVLYCNLEFNPVTDMIPSCRPCRHH
jgi:hypothetical protein